MADEVNQTGFVDTQTKAEKQKQKEKSKKCADCYFNVDGLCTCGESGHLNRVIFFFTKACEYFR